ncbi:MAG: hypothetical protein R3F10_07510 [Lysobacteraceae bacterium]
MKRLLVFVVVLALIGWWLSPPMARTRAPGVLAPDAPVQVDLDNAAVIDHNGIALTPLAKFSINARVLSREDYRFDAEAALSPMDLALGWGRMSDSAVLDQLDISQSVRFYSYRWRDPPPLPPQEMVVSSANMHMVPANSVVARQLKKVRRGDVVQLEGFLIEARREGGWHWRSSMTRGDSGAGACELVYVTSVIRLP